MGYKRSHSKLILDLIYGELIFSETLVVLDLRLADLNSELKMDRDPRE
jgi:hypothetical protein